MAALLGCCVIPLQIPNLLSHIHMSLLNKYASSLAVLDEIKKEESLWVNMLEGRSKYS
jgi:hypothetical protein